MQENLKSASNYITFYLLPMALTYVLPYFGSNSSVLNTLTLGLSPFYWLHLLACIALIVVAAVRGNVIGNMGLVVFPICALVFDFAPVLNWIPFVPTGFHILALLIGASSSARSVPPPRY